MVSKQVTEEINKLRVHLKQVNDLIATLRTQGISVSVYAGDKDPAVRATVTHEIKEVHEL